jgi:GT2 family glycosyltransferase
VIDVIIPVYNKPELLVQCLRALDGSTRVDYNLVIADDNSSDPKMKAAFKGHKVIANKGARGFPNNCNYTVSQTKSEFICLLNNDTAATPLWLDVMLREMDDPSVGIVGARLLYPGDHKLAFCLQHAGVAHNRDGMPYHIYRGMGKHFPPANERREINAVTFAVVLIRRKLWEELGGLDETYVGGQFEDMDFCARARAADWKIVYQPLALLYHYEHGSGEEFVADTADKNARLFRSKWGARGSDEHLFKLTGLEEHKERLADVMHQLRARSLRYLYENLTKERIERCQRISRLPYKNLPEEDRLVALDMASIVLKALSEFTK